jgi:phosphatidylserine/phosphatidylglycerophosphate/cardiolipin synthase-like enzyme
MNIYIHAKLGIVDDKWATIGTSNLDGTSMNRTDWYSSLDVPVVKTEIVREADEHRRSVETNAVIFDGAGGEPVTGFALDLRRRLWAEHLGLAESSPVLDPANRPAGGWLQLWNNKVAAFKAALNADPPNAAEGARVLDWNANTDDALRYVLDAGINKADARFRTLFQFPSFDFKKGKF